jgi:transposase
MLQRLHCRRGGRDCSGRQGLERAEALVAWFAAFGAPMEWIGLEAGPLSQWLHAGMSSAGLPVELLETWHVRAAFRTMPVIGARLYIRPVAIFHVDVFRCSPCQSPGQDLT